MARLAGHHGERPATRPRCRPAGSPLAFPLGFVVVAGVPLELAEELGNLALLPARDELLKGTGHGGLFGGLTAHTEGVIEEILIKSEGERDELLQLCGQRLDAFRVEDGNPQRLEVAKERTAIRS